jgi:ankyrin repeat protein
LGVAGAILNPADDERLRADVELLGDLMNRLLAGLDLNFRDEKGATPLHRAAGSGLFDSTAFLMAQQVEIDSLDPDGQTPLFFAVKTGNHDVAEFLAASGADVNRADGTGRTPLMFAAMKLNLLLVQLLLCMNADPNRSDCKGLTSLQHAEEALKQKSRLGRVTKMQKEVVKVLAASSA